jgi:anhydro-N-acetylmuramic acid kinase
MVYKVIGLMSGSSMDGLDIAFVNLQHTAGKWSYEIEKTACYPYDLGWTARLKNASGLSAKDYLLLHADYGHLLGQMVNRFIESNGLEYNVQLIASHGHTVFHMPGQQMTAQLGDGAAIAAETSVHVISDLRAMDLALGGQGAPIVPIGEKLLLGDYDLFCNIGGIANLSAHYEEEKGNGGTYLAFDVCPANRVLNMLAQETGQEFDRNGGMAEKGILHKDLLERLNRFSYYEQPFPKSLANEFGTHEIFPLVRQWGIPAEDALRTCVEHIALQITRGIQHLLGVGQLAGASNGQGRLLVTGGGAHNTFLIHRLTENLGSLPVQLVIPEKTLIDFKEALVMALIGALRWREEENVLASVTGARRDSVGGAVWLGHQ